MMGSPGGFSTRGLFLAAVFIALAGQDCRAFYLPGKAPVNFCTKETESRQSLDGPLRDQSRQCKSSILMYTNRLDAIQTLIPYAYDRFDFCKIQVPEEAQPVQNFGQVLQGDHIRYSPYNFSFNEPAECVKVCEKTYDPKVKEQEEKLNFLHKAIALNYQQHWIVDNMPVTWCYQVEGDQKYCSPVFPVGCYVDKHGIRKDACVIDANYGHKDTYYLFNHINFTIVYHPIAENLEMARIITIKVEPHSINHKKTGGKCLTSRSESPTSAPMAIPAELKEPISITYSFNVKFEMNEELRWASRWDYILDSMPHSRVQWFGIINSLILVLFLVGILAVAILRSVYNIEWAKRKTTVQNFHWKLVYADVFRRPRGGMLLSVLLGSGTQVVLVTFATLVFASLGFLSPANRGALVMCVVILFVCFGMPAGYVSARMYKTFGGERWKTNAVLTGLLIPGVIFFNVLPLNAVHWSRGSSAAIPSCTLLSLLAVWFVVAVPFVCLGSFLAVIRKPIEFPVPTNPTPRLIPRQPYIRRTLPAFILGGFVPFGCMIIHLAFVFNSIWFHQFYNTFGFLFLVAVIVVMTCSEMAILFCFLQLGSQNYHWWWRAFSTSGCTAVYFVVYCVYYLVAKLTVQDTASVILYFGYSSIMALLLFLFTGTVGFFGCFCFVLKIYGTLDPKDLDTSWGDEQKDSPPEKMVPGGDEGKDEAIVKEIAVDQGDEKTGSEEMTVDTGKEAVDEKEGEVAPEDEGAPPKEMTVGGENEERLKEGTLKQENEDPSPEKTTVGGGIADTDLEDVSVVDGGNGGVHCPQI